MSLQWYIVTLFLYLEVAVITLLLLPIISMTRWKQLFESRIATKIFRSKKSHLIFKCIVGVLAILLLDAVWDIVKYERREEELHHLTPTDLVAEFRAQRNLFISGTALFLFFVANRLVWLISSTGAVIQEKHLEQQLNHSLKSQLDQIQKSTNESLKPADKKKE